ncbi:MAG: hypothetical protein FJ035_02440 [Chloroflexi bacterium]|nr:hypothetical protein [Chloroflexota bacterium]
MAALALVLAVTGAVNAWGALARGSLHEQHSPAAAEATRLMLLSERLVATAGAAALVPIVGEWQQGVLTQADDAFVHLHTDAELDAGTLRRLETA